MIYKIELYTVNVNGSVTKTDITTSVPQGLSLVKKLDETLDYGSITIKNDRSEPYDIFDTIAIYTDGTLRDTLRIAGDKVDVRSKNPLRYTHNVTLVEHTKILENFYATGFKVTQPLTGTKKTLKDVVQTLRNNFPVEVMSKYATTRLFNISASVLTLLDNYESPEFTFVSETLKEALEKILGVIGGFPRLVLNSLDPYSGLYLEIDFFNEVSDLIISEGDFISKERMIDNEFYATSLLIDAINVTNENNDEGNFEIYPDETLFTTPRSDEFFLSPTTMYIPTPKPIYTIGQVIWKGKITTTGATTNLTNSIVEIDITDRVVEKSKYDTFDTDKQTKFFEVLGSSIYDERQNPENFFQSNTIYYNYAEKNIQASDLTGLWDATTNLDNAIKCGIVNYFVEQGYISSVNDWYTMNITIENLSSSFTKELAYLFRVKYKSRIPSLVFTQDREDVSIVDKESYLVANQQSRIVDLENLVKNAGGKINRLGNGDFSFENRVTSYTDLYNIGDYTSDNFIIDNREIILLNDFIYAKYSATKNFNRISKFLGVNSEIRQWEIGEKGRTLDRDIYYKEFIEVDAKTSGTGSSDSELLTTLGISTFMDTFDTTASSVKAQLCSFRSYTNSIVNIENVEFENSSVTVLGVNAPFSANGVNKTLQFNMEFDHNKSAGDYINALELIAGEEPLNQYAKFSARYTDDDAQFDEMEIQIAKEYGTTSSSAQIVRGFLFPNILAYTGTYISARFKVDKDSRDIIKVSLKEQIVSKDTSKVVVGEALAKRNRLLSNTPPTGLKLYTYDSGIKFTQNDTTEVLTGWSNIDASPSLTIGTYEWSITSANLSSSNSSWALTDENDNILIAVNQDGTLLDTVTFDFNNKRSNIKYEY